MKKSLSALIEKVLSEETDLSVNGKLEKVTLEEAIIRAAARRAQDDRNRLSMESTRFLMEYQYGKPVQPTVVAVNRFGMDSLDEYTEDELREIEEKLLRGASYGHSGVTPKDPGRFIEEGRRDQIVQDLVIARGESGIERNKRASARAKEVREEIKEEERRCDEENPVGTDELCDAERRLVEEPWC